MTELLIDGKRVSLPSDLSFDLIFENPYFTKSSTHTLDVDLPMPTNRHVFGMLHRMDVTKQKVTLPAVLIADGYQLLNGKALVLGTTDQTVKIQLMSGNAEFNFLTNGDIYLDEVDWANDDYTYTNGYYLSYIKTEDVLSGPGYNGYRRDHCLSGSAGSDSCRTGSLPDQVGSGDSRALRIRDGD